jgi:hypothetical protein
MLIELTRLHTDDDGVESTAPISINPTMVAAVFASAQSEAATIVRLADGRGFVISGTYADVMAALRGGSTPAPEGMVSESEAVN